MSPFTTVRSKAIPLPEANVDTDQIIPAQYVNAVGSAALAEALFKRLRERDPQFVFNRPEMQGRSIMLVGENFGCGSSREAAAWALQAWGIRALIGLSFNATFHANCLQNGLLPVTVERDVHSRLSPDDDVLIDLPAGSGQAGSVRFPIRIEPFARELLLRGIDELDYLMECRAEIAAYELR